MRGHSQIGRTKVLVVDDDPAMRAALEVRVRSWRFEVRTAADGVEGRELAERFQPDIVVTDLVMPELSGLELLRALKKDDPHRHVLLVTAEGGIEDAVEAMKQGARDFLTKPLDYDKLRSLLDDVSRDVATRQQSERLSGRLQRDSPESLLGHTKKMREVFGLIERVGASDTSVLIIGESGTGKELVAKEIHRVSRRRHGPFVPVNAAAVPEGLIESEFFGHEKGAFTGALTRRPGSFELANQGTLFLDEIAEMSIALQPKLLRVLNDGRVRRLGGREEIAFDVRVIAASNRDPARAMEEGSLREDLYYRLAVFTIQLPALRERRSDIPLLSQRFVEDFRLKHNARVTGIRESAVEHLQRYPWPGNVRELRNVMERAVVLANEDDWVELRHLPPYIRDPDRVGPGKVVLDVGDTTIESAERQLILKTLERVGNNKAEAARLLGLDVKTIRNKLNRYLKDSVPGVGK